MFPKLKAKNCKVAKCKAEFIPKVRWQLYCCEKCQTAAQNARRANFIRRAKKIMEREVSNG